ncbi:MAG: hypothetical protein O7I93_12970 [Gemmatimonadetes bacterium]|nr:hypothetical protein [Gemmatimonadota bacterium]
MTRSFPDAWRATPLVALLLVQACGDITASELLEALEFSSVTIDLDFTRDTTLTIRNTGSEAAGPVLLATGPVVNSGGNVVTGPVLTVSPTLIPTLNPGASATLTISLDVPIDTPEDAYFVSLEATIPDAESALFVDVGFSVIDPASLDVTSVVFTSPSTTTIRQGDVQQFVAEAFDDQGAAVTGARIRWSVAPASGGFIDADGRFAPYGAGTPMVIAAAGAHADTVVFTVTARGLTGGFSVVGHGEVLDRVTSDLWIHGTAAYTGTWGTRTSAAGTFSGNTLNTWDVSNTAAPTLVHSMTIDARTINDVKVSSDGTLGLITHEGSNDLQNGITLLDLSNPLAPSVITRTTNTLEPGVHNAWIEGDYVYLAVDGSSTASGLRILDVSDPSNPNVVAQFYGGSSFLHDVYVRDGLAFLSHWNAGLIILDVGSGIAGGSPENPVEVSRLPTQGGQTHNAWYWPAGGYVFVGEEDFQSPGIMHVIDVSDMWNPLEVATFRSPGTTPHNFWMDEAQELIYLSWYSNGLHALDVSGQLLGELEEQGREFTGFLYAQGLSSFATQNWAVQLHNGLVYVSDMNSGLWILQPGF